MTTLQLTTVTLAALLLLGATCVSSEQSADEVCVAGETVEGSGLNPGCVEALQLDTTTRRETDVGSGVEACPGDTFNRAYAQGCSACYEVPRCSEQDCACGSNAICAHTSSDECGCVPSPCASDADCEAGQACVCPVASADGEDESPGSVLGILWPVCVPASCARAADCDGSECGVGLDACGRVVVLTCRSDDDECGTQRPCDDGSRCVVDGDTFRCASAADCD